MLRSFKPFRSKWTIIFVAVLIIVTFGYGINARYYYPELNTEAVQFLIKDKKRIPDKNNSLYPIIGFNAPSNIQDIHEFGLNLVNKTLDKCLDADRKYLSLDTKLLQIDNELTFNADADKLHCWLNNDNSTKSKCSKSNKEVCYSESELRKAVIDNTILLARHEQLKKYTKFDNKALFAQNAGLLINTHRLFLANNRLNLDQGHEGALRLLIQDLEYHRTLMNQQGTMIDKAIKLVLYNLSLEQLEYAITRHTDVALKYKTEIDAALSELTINEFNLDGIFREEFEIINSVYCIDERLGIDTPDYCQDTKDIGAISENYIINDYYGLYLNYKSMLNLDMAEMVEQCSIYSNKPDENIYLGMLLHLPILPTYASYTLIKGGINKGCELMESHKKKNIKHLELKAYLNLAKNSSGTLLNAK